MWLTMRGALRRTSNAYRHLPSMAGIATAIYEGVDDAPNPAIIERQRRHVATDLPASNG
jgi:gallate dioxygenase